jgi:hypothetical protein
MVELYLNSLTRLHGGVLNSLTTGKSLPFSGSVGKQRTRESVGLSSLESFIFYHFPDELSRLGKR